MSCQFWLLVQISRQYHHCSGVMTIFFYKGLTRNLAIGNTIWVLSNIWRLGWVRDTKFGMNVSDEMLLNAAKCQVTTFVSGLLRENQFHLLISEVIRIVSKPGKVTWLVLLKLFRSNFSYKICIQPWKTNYRKNQTRTNRL